METYINPWVFYAMSVAETIDFYASLISVISVFIFVAFAVIYFWFFLCDYDVELDKCKTYLPTTKTYVIATIITIIITIIIPSKEVMIQMLVADNLTHDNVQAVIDASIQIINALKE